MLDIERTRSLRGDLDPAPVDHLGHRVRRLVEPHLVGAAPVAVARGRNNQERGIGGVALERRRLGGHLEPGAERDLRGGDVRPVPARRSALSQNSSKVALGAAVFAIARHDSRRCSAKVAALKTVFSDPGTSARPASSRRSPAAFVSTPGTLFLYHLNASALDEGLMAVLPQLSAKHQVLLAAVADPRVERLAAGLVLDAAQVYERCRGRTGAQMSGCAIGISAAAVGRRRGGRPARGIGARDSYHYLAMKASGLTLTRRDYVGDASIDVAALPRLEHRLRPKWKT